MDRNTELEMAVENVEDTLVRNTAVRRRKVETVREKQAETDSSAAESVTPEYLKGMLHRLTAIELLTGEMNDRLHQKYTEDNLEQAQNNIRVIQEKAESIYDELMSPPAKDTPDDENDDDRDDDEMDEGNPDAEFERNLKRWKKLGDIEGNKEIYHAISAVLSSEVRDQNGHYRKLLNRYKSLNYSFRTAMKGTQNFIWSKQNPESKDVWVILLFKNVRIMEDMITKICTNNIDKSIVSGEQHFDSIRYGFEWLFCHEDLNKSAMQSPLRQLDIRDVNRYLDYIKYQIMESGKKRSGEPQKSEEIDAFFDKIRTSFEGAGFQSRKDDIAAFKRQAQKLIQDFFKVYEVLIKYRDAILREEEIRKSLGGIPAEVEPTVEKRQEHRIAVPVKIVNLSSVAVRVLLDRFVSFVKISDLNFGNSTFYQAWFNYSELSKSNYAGSNFKYARIENAKMKDCDISTCNLILADGGHTDFSGSNFNYSNMAGINLVDSTVNNCEFQNAVFLDTNISHYQDAISDAINRLMGEGYEARQEKLRILSDCWKVTRFKGNTDPIRRNINDFVSLYKTFPLPCLNIRESSERQSWSVLRCAEAHELQDSICFKSKELLRRVFSLTISAELLDAAKDIFANQTKESLSERKSKYGDVILEGANLTNLSAKGALLGGSDLSHIEMPNASFENADMSGVKMHYTRGDAASFIATNLNHAECFEAALSYSSFATAVVNNGLFLNCTMNHTNWNRSILINSAFVDCSMFVEDIVNNRHLQYHPFSTDLFIRYDRQDAMILDRPNYTATAEIGTFSQMDQRFWQQDCSISDSSFVDTLADSTIFLNICADRCSFNRASIKNSFWANCRSHLSDFIDADLRYSYFALCCMGQSNFSNANISSAILYFIDLSGCNLSNTLFNLSNLNHILVQNANLKGINFSEAEICNSAFEGSKFTNAVISGAKFSNCVFSYVDFRGLVGFHSAVFEDCLFYQSTLEQDGEYITLDGKVDPHELLTGWPTV